MQPPHSVGLRVAAVGKGGDDGAGSGGGAVITGLEPGGLAETSGQIALTDVITEINKKPAAQMLDGLASLTGDVLLTLTSGREAEPDVRLATLLAPSLQCLDESSMESTHDVIVVEIPMESDPKKGDDEFTPLLYQYSSSPTFLGKSLEPYHGACLTLYER